MKSQDKCPICGEVITAEVEDSGFERYDMDQLHEAICYAVGYHIITTHIDKNDNICMDIIKEKEMT